MTFWYSEPKQGQTFGLLNCSDYEITSFSAKFDELRLTLAEDGHYYFWGNCLKASDCKKYQEDGFRLEDKLVSFCVHSKQYKKRKKVDGKYVEVDLEPSALEQCVIEAIKEAELDCTGTKTYKGVIDFGMSMKTKLAITTGQTADGKPTKFDDVISWLGDILNLSETEPEKLKTLVFTQVAASSNSGYNRTPAETEAQRLDARWNFFKQHFSLGEGINSLSELAHYESQLEKQYRDVHFRALELWKTIFD